VNRASIIGVAALITLGSAHGQACTPATWYTLAGTAPRPAPAHDVLADMARREVVLLGEHHDDAEHHHWELQTLSALHVLRPDMIIGFESFPRRVQPTLDQWTAGELTADEFLERVEWRKIWNVAPELYLPLFQFARLNRILMVALNVDRAMIQAISTQGWDGAPAQAKEGLSKPARAVPAYEDFLFDVFKQHPRPKGKESIPPSRTDSEFRYFVDSQTTWDRVMAETLAARLKSSAGPHPLVVGIMGEGHVRFGYGVPHQLRDLGVSSVGTLLPVSVAGECRDLKPGLADAVFALPASPREKPPAIEVDVRLDDRNATKTAAQSALMPYCFTTLPQRAISATMNFCRVSGSLTARSIPSCSVSCLRRSGWLSTFTSSA
jgi:uncharacterized iron-regulated protein